MNNTVVKEIMKRLAFFMIGGYIAKKINDAVDRETERKYALTSNEPPKVQRGEWKRQIKLNEDEYSIQ